MMNLIKSIVSLFVSYDDENSLEEEEDKLMSATVHDDPFILENSLHSDSCYGTITFINHSVAIIDHNYYFHIQNAMSHDLSFGDYVKFTLYKKGADVIVRNVQKIKRPVEDPVCITSGIDDCVADKLSVIIINGVVSTKKGRIVFVSIEGEDEKLSFDLNSISSEFIPLQDDLVELEVFINSDNTKVVSVRKVSPKATTTKRGVVTNWDVAEGVISDFAMFTLESCEPGYTPAVGDKVLASLIRVINPKGYMWRAIQVISRFNCVDCVSRNLKEARQDLVENAHGMIIPVFSKFVMKINTTMEFIVEIENKNDIAAELLSVFSWPYGYNKQISLVSSIDRNTIIHENEKLNFSFKIKAKFIGYSSTEYIWEFTGFRISRMFEIHVISRELNEIWSEKSLKELPTSKSDVSAIMLIDRSSGCIMPAQKKYSRVSMFPVQLGQYSLPENILIAALPDNQMNLEDLLIRVEEILPCLKEDPSPRIYSSRFTALLFLEEVEHLKQLGELFMERSHFTRAGEFLILKVPHLSMYANKLIPGDRIIASLPWNKNNYKYEGIIHRITHNEIWINFPIKFHDAYIDGTEYSLSFVTSRVNLRRMHQAVNLARKFLGDNWLFPTGVQMSPPQVIFGNQSQFDKNLCVEETGPKSRRHSKKIKWNRHGSGYGRNCTVDNVVEVKIGPKNINDIEWFNKMLNSQQKAVVKNILKGEARPLPYIIFGPPGTGKSLTVVETVLQLNSLFSNSRILVATPSNSAADLITQRLLEVGKIEQNEILRLVGVSAYEQGRLAASIIPYAAILDAKNHDGSNRNFGIQVIGRDLLSQYRVVIGTIGCIGSLFNMGFPRGHFTHIFVDEAGQATEPEILTSLILLNTRNGQVVLAGDPFQLGPVVYSKLAAKYGLEESLLVRLLDRFPYKKDLDGFPDTLGYDPRLVTKLIHNYRSLTPILHIPNMLFYDNHLISEVSEKIGEEIILLKKLAPYFSVRTQEGSVSPVIFHGVRGKNCQEDQSHSWFNPQEAYQVFLYLNVLYNAGVSPDYIGIISPYQLQTLKIRQMLEHLNLEPPKIGSIEEFQGQEKMIIILSVVRSSLEGISHDMQRALGFVRNPKRLNVAISRARALLIIIGNPHFLCFDMLWRKILKHCILNEYYTGCDPPTEIVENKL